jgi:hypothetical protein
MEIAARHELRARARLGANYAPAGHRIRRSRPTRLLEDPSARAPAPRQNASYAFCRREVGHDQTGQIRPFLKQQARAETSVGDTYKGPTSGNPGSSSPLVLRRLAWTRDSAPEQWWPVHPSRDELARQRLAVQRTVWSCRSMSAEKLKGMISYRERTPRSASVTNSAPCCIRSNHEPNRDGVAPVERPAPSPLRRRDRRRNGVDFTPLPIALAQRLFPFFRLVRGRNARREISVSSSETPELVRTRANGVSKRAERPAVRPA